jgi:hypothetical protein
MIVSQYTNSTLNQLTDRLKNNNNLIYQLDSNPLTIIFSPIYSWVMSFYSSFSLSCSCLASVVLAPTNAFFIFFFQPLMNFVQLMLNQNLCNSFPKMKGPIGHETSAWPQLYEIDLDFATTYQMLGENAIVDNFHIQYGLLCLLGHIYVPSSERVKMIWESHYSQVAGHFSVEMTVEMLQKHFYRSKLQQEVSKCIRSCTACAISKPTTKK